jgi:aminoglycoside/choline kinase family phosphotransferase
LDITKSNHIISLFRNWTKEEVISINKLPISGSSREYYRIKSENKAAIATYNDDLAENIAFIEFSNHFHSKNLNVPKIYATHLDQHIYLQEDIGDTTLFSHLIEQRKEIDFPEELVKVYKSVLSELLKFQIIGGEKLDYTKCYPRANFDKQSMSWDLNYFKYYFLKLSGIQFNEQLLENDFHTLIEFLLSTNCNYFLYRDFQSRNIMIKENKLFFIDYQGGRKGALQYDVASLLYDAKADIPQEIRIELLHHYIDTLNQYIEVDSTTFKEYYYGYVLIRMMQAMGAYGYRGFYEKKKHFLQSIPYAINNLNWILKNIKLPIEIPELMKALNKITVSKKLKKYKIIENRKSPLIVSINSFAFKNGIPKDNSQHSGGFVFDCRAIHNPGRYKEYKELTGKDKAVISFFSKEDDMHDFLENVFSLVDMSVEKYIERNFTNLMVSFGCTGGQHRSVYSAENLTKHLRKKYNVQVVLWHREIE